MKTRKHLATVVALLVLLLLTVHAAPQSSVQLGHGGSLATSSADVWSPPVNLSGPAAGAQSAKLVMGADGTIMAVWTRMIMGTPWQYSLWAAVRPPGGSWSSAVNVTGWQDYLLFEPYTDYMPRAAVAPDGTAWVVWMKTDSGQPGNNRRVMISHKSPGGSWQSASLSDWEAIVRSVDLAIGPDGDMVAIWTGCSSGTTTYQGNCAVRLRRRPAGAPAWETVTRIDNATSLAVRTLATPRVGPGGMIVVLWLESDGISQLSVWARAYSPTAGAWGTGASRISTWGVEDLAQPVMYLDGTVVAAWEGKSADPSKQALFSATRAVGSGAWNNPVEISSRYVSSSQSGIAEILLAAGWNGTTVAAWEYWASGTSKAIFANARDAGGVWGSEFNVSGWKKSPLLEALDIWPGGAAMVLWREVDDGLPATADSAVFWSGRPPHGTWGTGGQGRLGDWTGGVYGADLVLGSDGSGVALVASGQPDPPAGPQMSTLAFVWPPGGPWDAPETLATGSQYTYLGNGALTIGHEGRPVGAIWIVTMATSGDSAVFFSEMGGEPARQPRVFFPVVMKR